MLIWFYRCAYNVHISFAINLSFRLLLFNIFSDLSTISFPFFTFLKFSTYIMLTVYNAVPSYSFLLIFLSLFLFFIIILFAWILLSSLFRLLYFCTSTALCFLCIFNKNWIRLILTIHRFLYIFTAFPWVFYSLTCVFFCYFFRNTRCIEQWNISGLAASDNGTRHYSRYLFKIQKRRIICSLLRFEICTCTNWTVQMEGKKQNCSITRPTITDSVFYSFIFFTQLNIIFYFSSGKRRKRGKNVY